MEVRLYVGNLPKTITPEELTTLFAQAGTVNSVDVIKDRHSGEVKGFAFVNMNSQEEADKAISQFNGYTIGENAIKVNVAKPRV